jgi:hypothetical protein
MVSSFILSRFFASFLAGGWLPLLFPEAPSPTTMDLHWSRIFASTTRCSPTALSTSTRARLRGQWANSSMVLQQKNRSEFLIIEK